MKELPDLPDIRLGSNGTPSTVDLGPLPPRNQVTVEVEVAPEAEIGPVSFRLLTPLGTSPEGPISGRAVLRRSARPGTRNDTPERRIRDVPARDPDGHDRQARRRRLLQNSRERRARRFRFRTARC